jgi:ABC-type nitrate/sulfonate/bicarbonate transport system substrate-binding protein
LNHYLEKYGLLYDISIKHYEQAEFIAIDIKRGFLEGGFGTPALAAFTSTILKAHLIVEAKDLWPNNPSYGIFAHKVLIKNNPEIIFKFLIHHKKASHLLRNSPSEAAKKIAKTFEIINSKYVETVLRISPKYCIALSEGYIKATMEFVWTLYKLGYIKTNFSLEDIFDFSLINEIHPEPNHY